MVAHPSSAPLLRWRTSVTPCRVAPRSMGGCIDAGKGRRSAGARADRPVTPSGQSFRAPPSPRPAVLGARPRLEPEVLHHGDRLREVRGERLRHMGVTAEGDRPAALLAPPLRY